MTPQEYGRQLAFCFLATLLILGVLVLLTVWIGEPAPPVPFPFSNRAQLESSSPGLDYEGMGPFMCYGQMVGFRYVHTAGAAGWATYVATATGRFVSGYFPNPSEGQMPAYLWIGRVDDPSGHMIVERERPFDPVDTSPCQLVVVPTPSTLLPPLLAPGADQ